MGIPMGESQCDPRFLYMKRQCGAGVWPSTLPRFHFPSYVPLQREISLFHRMVKWKEKWAGEIAWLRRLEYKNHAYTLESFRCVNSVQHPTSVIRSTETKALIKGLSLEIIQGWVMPGAKGNFFAKAYLPAASWPLVLSQSRRYMLEF